MSNGNKTQSRVSPSTTASKRVEMNAKEWEASQEADHKRDLEMSERMFGFFMKAADKAGEGLKYFLENRAQKRVSSQEYELKKLELQLNARQKMAETSPEVLMKDIEVADAQHARETQYADQQDAREGAYLCKLNDQQHILNTAFYAGFGKLMDRLPVEKISTGVLEMVQDDHKRNSTVRDLEQENEELRREAQSLKDKLNLKKVMETHEVPEKQYNFNQKPIRDHVDFMKK